MACEFDGETGVGSPWLSEPSEGAPREVIIFGGVIRLPSAALDVGMVSTSKPSMISFVLRAAADQPTCASQLPPTS